MEHKFKKGDKVEFISATSHNASYFKHGLTDLTIDCFNGNTEYVVWESDHSENWNVKERELRLMEVTDWKARCKR